MSVVRLRDGQSSSKGRMSTSLVDDVCVKFTRRITKQLLPPEPSIKWLRMGFWWWHGPKTTDTFYDAPALHRYFDRHFHQRMCWIHFIRCRNLPISDDTIPYQSYTNDQEFEPSPLVAAHDHQQQYCWRSGSAINRNYHLLSDCYQSRPDVRNRYDSPSMLHNAPLWKCRMHFSPNGDGINDEIFGGKSRGFRIAGVFICITAGVSRSLPPPISIRDGTVNWGWNRSRIRHLDYLWLFAPMVGRRIFERQRILRLCVKKLILKHWQWLWHWIFQDEKSYLFSP